MIKLKSLTPKKQPSKRFFVLCLRNFSLQISLVRDDEAFVSQIVDLLKPPETQWDFETLRNVLFTETPSSPKSLIHIARRLKTSSKALRFFDFLESNSNLPQNSPTLSSAFQAVLELAAREPNSEKKLAELFAVSRKRNVSLSINAATLLINSFGKAKMADEVLSVFESLETSCRNAHVCNKTLIALLRLGRFDEALKVLDEMLQPNSNSRPNELTGEIVFPTLLRRYLAGKKLGDDDIARLITELGRFGAFPKPVDLSGVIANFCRFKKVNLAWNVLEALMASKAPITAASCNAMLSGLAKSKDAKRMNELMAKMKELGIEPSVFTFGILIDFLCKSRRVDEALEAFGRMRESETGLVKPDTVIYNSLIDGLCKVGRQDQGLSLLEEMRSGSECKPSAATFNCLIDGFNKVGEYKTASEVFDRMRHDGVAPNVITLNSLVDGLCREGRVNSAVVLFDEMRREYGIEGNVVTYTSLITAFCGVNNISKAMELFEEMSEKGCSADSIAYCSLISGLSRAGRMNEACLVAKRMKDAGFSMDIIAYNVLISGFCKTKKLDMAYETILEMEDLGIKPDTFTYNTLISCLCKMGNLEIAQEILEKMREDGLSPTVVTYGALIHGFCVNKDTEEAMKLFRDMCSRSKVAPNTVIYNILVNSLCKNQETERALAMIEDMKSKGVKPDTNTFNSVLKGLMFDNSLDKAFEVMDQMVEHGCGPDYITMEVLTEWLSQVGKIDKLKQFLRAFESSK